MLRISWTTGDEFLTEDGLLARTETEYSIAFDAVTSETHEGTSTLTEHAVESGAPLTDHKRANPRRVTIEALVTQTPLDRPPPSGYGAAHTIDARVRKGEDTPAVVVFDVEFDRIADVLVTLDRLRLEATPVTLSTKHRTYEQVQITDVTEPREAGDGDSQRFTIGIQEVRVAESRTVDSPRPREPRGGATVERGGQEGTDAADENTSTITRARDEYERRRAAGESPTEAAAGAMDVAFGG